MTLDVYCGRKTTMQQQMYFNVEGHRNVQNKRLLGCFEVNGFLKLYFSRYWAVSNKTTPIPLLLQDKPTIQKALKDTL